MLQLKQEIPPLTLQMAPAIEVNDEDFFAFCQQNRELRIERTAKGEIIVEGLSGGETGSRNLAISAALYNWSQENGEGIGFDSSTGFILPNGATRSPDTVWVRRERLARLTTKEKQRFLPLCPDFVIELRSPSDSLPDIQDKMAEYIENGTLLGWLIDPDNHQVFVYQPGKPVVLLKRPETVSGDPVLPGFILKMAPIWKRAF